MLTKSWHHLVYHSLVVTYLVFVLSYAPTHASGLTTNVDNNPGQVVRNRDGEAMYLTATTNPDQNLALQANTAPTATQSATASATPAVATPSSQSSQPGTLLKSDIQVPTGFATDIGNVINSTLTLVMVVATLLVFVHLIWGGIQWIASGGDRSKTEQARSKIIAAIVGLLILAASYAILLLSLRFLGFSSIKDVFLNVRTIS